MQTRAVIVAAIVAAVAQLAEGQVEGGVVAEGRAGREKRCR